jgi:hypothetical protein
MGLCFRNSTISSSVCSWSRKLRKLKTFSASSLQICALSLMCKDLRANDVIAEQRKWGITVALKF